jgi:hypothetical protein
MKISQYALLSTLALGAALIGAQAAHATGVCECTECELASGTTTYSYEYDVDNEDSMQAGLAAQRKVKKMAKKEASDLSKKGPLCEVPCEASHVSYFVEPPSFMSTSTGGGYGEAKAHWRITGNCLKKKAGLDLGIGIGIGVGDDHHRDRGNDKAPKQEQTQQPH